MNWSINLGKLFGIRLKMHWTFFLILIWVGYITYSQKGDFLDFILTTALVLSIFACVVLHELGHALTARRYGIKTKRIILLPIGGVAQLEKFPRKPIQEFAVAIAGPLVNVAIAAVLFGLYFSFNRGIPDLAMQRWSGYSFVFQVAAINILIFAFNLIPAFPMDGGRILRALIATRHDYVTATTWAARTGQFFALIFAILGLFFNPFLIFIALFIFIGAGGEANMVKTRELIKDFMVKDAMLTKFTTLSPDDTLEKAAHELLAGSEKDFLVFEHEKPIGILTRKKLVEALTNHDKSILVKEIMTTEFPVVRGDDMLEEAVLKMRSSGLPILPVEYDSKINAISLDNISELFLVERPGEKFGPQNILMAR